MEVLHDAALGRSVRRFSEGMALFKQNPEWAFRQGYSGDIIRRDTPEAALKAAGLMEGEGVNSGIGILRELADTLEEEAKQVAEMEAELIRLRAVNAELVEALKWIASRYDDQKPVFECASDSYEMHCVAAQALSRAEQTKPEPETCVWTDTGDGRWETGCGWQAYFEDEGPAENGYKHCFRCGRQIKVTGKAGGRQG